MNPKFQRRTQILKQQTQIPKETQITNDHQNLKEGQISNYTQNTNEPHILKEHQISKETQIMNEPQF